MLLYTDEKIIDIALYYRFETQESFTRSFKKYYDLPPGQYRKLVSKLTLQKEEMTMKNEHLLKGWNLSGSHPFNYQMGIDRETFHKGQASGFLKSVTAESKEEFATMMQQFKAENYLGKRMKLSGFLKSKGVDGFCGLWMRVDNALHDVLQFDNMGNRPIVNDTEWNHYYIVLDVPKTVPSFHSGSFFQGAAKYGSMNWNSRKSVSIHQRPI
jgi:hypothetical protein